jgi:predicted nuclease of predicted toxin-antitoxin system
VIIWIDAHLSPQLARWIKDTFGVESFHVRDLGLHHAKDPVIFQRAREARTVVMSKDEDFKQLVERLGPPPQVIWVTSGNMSNSHFQSLLLQTFSDAVMLIEKGEAVVEICNRE